jgi:hypothetical protein
MVVHLTEKFATVMEQQKLTRISPTVCFETYAKMVKSN